ncbi:DUF1802 family protein [Kovacikia minuta CCNUW1]|uniref:DUF1802 family protein n=1 Tax=Kovacikia minuta TaxID=2931930 RepID=UPI001CCE6108|nr:DUF1802 family protein [Kovacikia minuta]UBF24880.1 DUF1802 family protein [Kovacikia minuta CCNUW1]
MPELHALKEWKVAVDALEQGEMILLLRKGGIREVSGNFALAHDQALLYPTFEHQKPHLLKEKYARQVAPVEPGWHPESVRIGAWAVITHTMQVSEPACVDSLLPFHIWNREFMIERLKWKPRQPLTLLLLRVYRLASPHMLAYDPGYGGCKSWISLNAGDRFRQ